MFGKISVSILAFALTLAFVPVSSLAKDSKEDKLAKALQKYEKTGKVKNCVRLTRIYSSKVIDDYNILFIMKGKKAYLNTLPRRCSRLGFEKSFSYSLSIGQLCNVDLITVVDFTSNIQGPTCGLGKFLEFKKIDKTAQAEAK